MLIDWFTVGAQLLNFIILLWLMKRFLYQPILNAIDARERKIAHQLSDAERISQEANQAKEQFERKIQAFDKEREQLMLKASQEANAERQRLIEQAHHTLASFQTQQRQAIEHQMQQLQNTISQAAQTSVLKISQNALKDLADANLEAQLVSVFIRRLNELDEAEQKKLKAALNLPPIQVLSSQSLSTDQQTKITSTLTTFLGEPLSVNFQQSKHLICGIELQGSGYKISWSVAEYLQCLKDALSDQMNANLTAHLSTNTDKDIMNKLNGNTVGAQAQTSKTL